MRSRLTRSRNLLQKRLSFRRALARPTKPVAVSTWFASSGSRFRFGICLGHQAIIQALGGTIVQAHQPVHGRQSEINHDGSKMFGGIKSPFPAGRYHSLVAQKSDLPDDFSVTATTDDQQIMAVEHNRFPIVGLQFHPESVLTECGYQLLINFLKLANLKIPEPDFWKDNPKGSWGNIFHGQDEPENEKLSDRLSQQETP